MNTGEEAFQMMSLYSQHSVGRAKVAHAVVVIFLEFFSWGLLTTPMLTVRKTPHSDDLLRSLYCLYWMQPLLCILMKSVYTCKGLTQDKTILLSVI